MRLIHLQHRPLRFNLKPPDRFNLIAEKLNANGLLRLRGKDVKDAAAQRILAGHLNRFATLIANALKMADDIFKRQFFAFAYGEAQLPVKFRRLCAQQGGGDGRNGNGDLLRRQPPQPSRSLFCNFRMRRQTLRRQHIQRRHR